MTWLVRPATVADAEGIARVHIDGWQGAYRHIFPADFLEGLGNTLDERTEWWRQWLAGLREQEGPPHWLFVAQGKEPGIGFVPCYHAGDADSVGVGEVAAIYISPSHWRRGIGRALMNTAVGDLRSAGFNEAILWVLEKNALARSFYEKEGWLFDEATKTIAPGSLPQLPGGHEAVEVRYSKRLID